MASVDYIPKIFEILNTFSKESSSAATEKCSELGFDPNRGEIPLDESFINLESASHILKDAIEKKKLIQLPYTVQREIHNRVKEISNFLTSLNAGTDEVINLVTSIEALNISIWTYGLHNLSKEVLGYLEKQNQLKKQSLEITKIQSQLEEAVAQKNELEKLLQAVQLASTSSQATLEIINGVSSKATETLTAITATNQTISATALAAEQSGKATNDQAIDAKAKALSIGNMEASIKQFFGEVKTHQTNLIALEKESKETVEKNTKKTNDLITELSVLEEGIKKQIEKATGFSLFHSFQTRQLLIANSKKFWIGALGACVLGSIALTLYVVHTTDVISTAFYLKLSLSLPIIYAISFCTIQYSRERKLEEEYAFKSSISISLDPYQALVSRIVDNQQVGEREKFIKFILDAIEKVFTSPTDKIFQPTPSNKGINEKSLKHIAEIIGSAARAAKP